jgi:two-component system OmpR family sensor kinase
MSLRTRLVATLLALAAIGMLALGVVTYASQRDYLYQRVDEQTSNALRIVGAKLDGFGGGEHGPGDRPKPDEVNLPSGTYGVHLDSAGNPTGSPTRITYGEEPLAAPKLPNGLKTGDVLTVDSVNGGELRYRVRVEPSPRGGYTLVAIPLTETEQTLERLLLVEGLVIGGVLLVLGLLSWLLVRVELRPLERIGRTADAIAAGDLSRRVEVAHPRSEVGRLGLALNAMLGNLEQAFAERTASEDRLRRFLADASHELRTPLASIRGYAELFRIGAAREPEEVEKAMRRIEEESERMGVLVEDLLTLARMDEVREEIRDPVDLAVLAEDAVADARAVDAERAIVLGDVDEDVVVRGNADHLRQVLANLVRNALVHTPPDASVEVAVQRTDDGVQLRVSDNGPGLPDVDPEELFGRFWRAEGGRERGRAGAGLGLAIVAAIVHAHGGQVHAENAPGGGAVFTVALPAAVPASSQPQPALR